MLQALLSISSRLTHRVDTPKLDDDGACPACDHPFGGSNHMCIGAVTRVAA
jgi:hypothetical protein